MLRGKGIKAMIFSSPLPNLGARQLEPKKLDAGVLRIRLSSIDLLPNPGLLLLLTQLGLEILLRLLLILLLTPLPLPILIILIVLLPRILPNGLVRLHIDVLQPVGLDLVLDVAPELGFVPLLVVVRQRLHVLGHVAAEDVLAQSFRV